MKPSCSPPSSAPLGSIPILEAPLLPLPRAPCKGSYMSLKFAIGMIQYSRAQHTQKLRSYETISGVAAEDGVTPSQLCTKSQHIRFFSLCRRVREHASLLSGYHLIGATSALSLARSTLACVRVGIRYPHRYQDVSAPRPCRLTDVDST